MSDILHPDFYLHSLIKLIKNGCTMIMNFKKEHDFFETLLVICIFFKTNTVFDRHSSIFPKTQRLFLHMQPKGNWE